MDPFITRENIDHFLELLKADGITPDRRDAITRLLLDEENKLSHDLEQLEFALTRAANGRDQLKQARQRLAIASPAIERS